MVAISCPQSQNKILAGEIQRARSELEELQWLKKNYEELEKNLQQKSAKVVALTEELNVAESNLKDTKDNI